MSGFEVQTASLTSEPVRRAALHAAYYLVEAVQLPDVVAARSEIARGLAEAERLAGPNHGNPAVRPRRRRSLQPPLRPPSAVDLVIDRSEALGEAGMLSAGLCLRADSPCATATSSGTLRMPAGPS